jgi:hypothetical protein
MHPNYYKYIHPPTIEQIEKVVRPLGISDAHFERIHGMNPGCIKWVRMGIRRMPVQHWHLFLGEPDAPIAKAQKEAQKMVEQATPKPVEKIAIPEKLSHLF